MISLALSLLLHAALFINITVPQPKPPEEKPKPPPPEERISLRIRAIDEDSRGQKCENFYVGVGLVQTFLTLKITYVAPGGPADRADIRVGDVLARELHLKHLKPGTRVNISLFRDGIMINKTITVEKICND